MKPTFHPALFLGAVIVLCTAWLWTRPPPATAAFTANAPRRSALVEPPSIDLDVAILERYAGRYEGRRGYGVDLVLRGNELSVHSPDLVVVQLRATSETEFFLKGMGWDLEFDVAADGTVRGFAVNTDYGLIEMTRVR
jgi:hypothetical protein